MKTKNTGISKRVKTFAVVMSALIVVMLLGGGYSWISQNQATTSLESNLSNVLETQLNQILLVKELQLHTLQVQQFLTDISATRALDGLDDGIYVAEIHRDQFNTKIQQAMKLAEQNHDSELLKSLKQSEAAFQPYYEMGLQLANAYIDDGPSAGNALMVDFDQKATKIQHDLAQLAQLIQNKFDHSGEALSASFTVLVNTRLLFIAVILLSGLGALAATWFCTILLTRFLVHPVQQLTQTVVAFSNQDFEREIPYTTRQDEIGEIAQAITILKENSQEALRLQDQESEQLKKQEKQEQIQLKAQAEVAAQKARLKAEQTKREEEEQQAREFKARVQSLLESMESIAAGNLQTEIRTSGNDELSRIGAGIDELQQTLRESMSMIAGNSQNLSGTSTEMNNMCTTMSSLASQNTSRAEEVNEKTSEVTQRISTIALSTSELVHSISEIARNASNGQRVANEAVNTTQSANKTIDQLNVSSGEIESVIKTITAIAEQTNLLALNATIEAARAGDAGKGFAVVANEVKELAKETAKATEDIGRKIVAIQSDTVQAVDAIARTTEIIGEINSIQTSIAAAVEEQNATTSQISSQVDEVSALGQSILGDTNQVADSARQNLVNIKSISNGTSELDQISSDFDMMLERFIIEG